MAFINEYISEEDIKKYDIRGIWKQFHPFLTDEELDLSVDKYSWTVDKDREIFFIPLKSGKDEFSNQKSCALWWKGHLLSVIIENVGGHLDYPNQIGSITWGLVNIDRPTDFIVMDSEVVSALKEALIVYRLRGIQIPIANYSVKFDF